MGLPFEQILILCWLLPYAHLLFWNIHNKEHENLLSEQNSSQRQGNLPYTLLALHIALLIND
jgi:hypothetical protein